MTEPLIGTQEAAQLLGVTTRHVTRLADEAELPPAMRLPGATGAYLFHRADVERYRDERASRQRHPSAASQTA